MKLIYILLFAIFVQPVFGAPKIQEGKSVTVPVKSSGPEVNGDNTVKFDYQVPDQKIIAPESVEQGEVVIATVSQLQNPPQYLAAATYRWKVLENGRTKTNVREWPDGTSVLFGAGVLRPGEGKCFTLILSISYLYVTKEKDVVTGIGQRSTILTAQTLVGGPAPGPGPGPAPGPGPGPTPVPVPDGKFGLVSKTYQLAMSSVSPESRAKGAVALVNSFNGIAASVAAGTLSDVKTLLIQSKTANQTALSNAGVGVADWDAFFTNLQKEIYQLYSSGKMTTIQDFADAWREISAGLEKVR